MPSKDTTPGAGVIAALKGLAQAEQRVLALEEHRRVEGPEGLSAAFAREAHENLGDGGPADRDVHPGETAAQEVSEREGRLNLTGEGHGDADDTHPGIPKPCDKPEEVVVEGVVGGLSVFSDLVGREKRERTPVRNEVDGEWLVGRTDNPKGAFDRRHRDPVTSLLKEPLVPSLSPSA